MEEKTHSDSSLPISEGTPSSQDSKGQAGDSDGAEFEHEPLCRTFLKLKDKEPRNRHSEVFTTPDPDWEEDGPQMETLIAAMAQYGFDSIYKRFKTSPK
jgi:hypothetical protein